MSDGKVKGPERTAQLVEALRRWQAIERESINHTAEMMEKTDNLLVRQILEIIRNDSVQHHRVQQFIWARSGMRSRSTTPRSAR